MATIAQPLSATDAALRDYSDAVARLPEVAVVAAMPGYEGLGIWTVLMGDVQGGARDAVYGLQMETVRRHADAVVSFRVLNASEFPGRSLDTLFPEGSRVVYVRSGVRLDAPPADAE